MDIQIQLINHLKLENGTYNKMDHKNNKNEKKNGKKVDVQHLPWKRDHAQQWSDS